jgi:hypothetical protein
MNDQHFFFLVHLSLNELTLGWTKKYACVFVFVCGIHSFPLIFWVKVRGTWCQEFLHGNQGYGLQREERRFGINIFRSIRWVYFSKKLSILLSVTVPAAILPVAIIFGIVLAVGFAFAFAAWNMKWCCFSEYSFYQGHIETFSQLFCLKGQCV